MEIQPEAKSIYLIDLDTSAQYDRKRKTCFVIVIKCKQDPKVLNYSSFASSVTRKNSPNVYKLPKNDFTRKMKDFNKFTKIASECKRFRQIKCCQRLLKVVPNPINRPIWSHCLQVSTCMTTASITSSPSSPAGQFVRANDPLMKSFWTSTMMRQPTGQRIWSGFRQVE